MTFGTAGNAAVRVVLVTITTRDVNAHPLVTIAYLRAGASPALFFLIRIAGDLWHCRLTLGRRSVPTMAALVTITFELALPGLLWLLWRAAERADRESATLNRTRDE